MNSKQILISLLLNKGDCDKEEIDCDNCFLQRNTIHGGYMCSINFIKEPVNHDTKVWNELKYSKAVEYFKQNYPDKSIEHFLFDEVL